MNNKFIAVLFLTIVFLTACQSKQTLDPEKIKMASLNQEKRMGVLQSLGGAMNSDKATHLLRMENGKTIFLKSSVLDLSSSKYQKNDVEVSGNLIRKTDGEQLLDVQSIDLIEKETASENVAPQWKNYNSADLLISLKYRDDFSLVEKDQQISLTGKTQKNAEEGDVDIPSTGIVKTSNAEDKTSSGDDYSMTIVFKQVSNDPKFDLLASLGLTSDSSTELLTKGYSKSKITAKAIDAIKESDKTGNVIKYNLKAGDRAYLVKMTINKSDNLIQDQNLFFDILSSVNFAAYSDAKPTI